MNVLRFVRAVPSIRCPAKLACLALALAFTMPARAQQPDALIHTVPAPLVGAQNGAQSGFSVAVKGGLAAVGAPFDDLGAIDAGVVKIFDATTGARLFLLPNPEPDQEDYFGWSVAISGTRVVVGAHLDDAGASNAGSVYVYELTSGTPTVPVLTLHNPEPAADDNFGRMVAISGTRIVIGAYRDDTGATDAGSAYVYDFGSGTPTVPVLKLHNPEPAAGDFFGWSIAIDGTHVVVGANRDDTGGSDAGTAYVYDLGGFTPTVPVVTLGNPNPALFGPFGWSVAIEGSRVVVGSRSTLGGRDSGAHVFDLAGATPTVPAVTLTRPPSAGADEFGWSVAISGNRVLVGALGYTRPEDPTLSQLGRAYLYDLGSATPALPTATLNNPTPAPNDVFGASVAIDGTRALIGAYGADSTYIYELGSATPTVPAFTLSNPGPATQDHFGYSVAVSGPWLVVGAPEGIASGIRSGNVFVFDLSSATPTVPAFALETPFFPADGNQFGFAVAIDGTRAVVGAPGSGSIGGNVGRAYVYDLSGATPTTPVASLTEPLPVATGDRFGHSVAVSGTRVVIGAYGSNVGATDAGSTYVFEFAGGITSVPAFILRNPSPAASDFFGYAVAIDGPRVVVGAYGDDTNANDSGSAYVYDLGSATPTIPTLILSNPHPVADDEYASAVAISGTRVVISSVGDDTGASAAGSAYVFDLASATPTAPIFTLRNPAPSAIDLFGNAVAISGSRVVIGAYWDDTGAENAGSAYLYDLASATPTAPVAALHNPGPAPEESFGWSVAIDGDTVAIGTPYDDSIITDKGAAYVFGPSSAQLPEITVEKQPANSNVSDGDSHDFGPSVPGLAKSVTFTVKNTGPGNLLLTATPRVAVNGPDASMFTITTQPAALISGPTGSTTFTVQFLPAASGAKTAALSIANNDSDENPFDIPLTGTALTFAIDSDGDGLSDASELQMGALGFDWQTSQPALVETYFASANGAGLFTTAQIQALNIGTPLLQRNPATGAFTLTIGVEKSTDLNTFLPFPMTAPQTIINGAGKLEFQFTAPDAAAFFRLRVQ